MMYGLNILNGPGGLQLWNSESGFYSAECVNDYGSYININLGSSVGGFNSSISWEVQENSAFDQQDVWGQCISLFSLFAGEGYYCYLYSSMLNIATDFDIAGEPDKDAFNIFGWSDDDEIEITLKLNGETHVLSGVVSGNNYGGELIFCILSGDEGSDIGNLVFMIFWGQCGVYEYLIYWGANLSVVSWGVEIETLEFISFEVVGSSV